MRHIRPPSLVSRQDSNAAHRLDRFTKKVQASVDRVAVLRQVVRVELIKGLVAPDLVCSLAVVVVGDLLVGLVNGHGESE